MVTTGVNGLSVSQIHKQPSKLPEAFAALILWVHMATLIALSPGLPRLFVVASETATKSLGRLESAESFQGTIIHDSFVS